MDNIIDLKDILWKTPLNHWEYDLNKLVNVVEDLSIKCTGKEQLCKMIGVYRDFLDRLEEKYNIKINYNFTLNKTDPNFKAIYQNYDWCYQKYLIEGLNHREMAQIANCSKRVVEKWCSEKHRLTQKYRQIHKELSSLQKDFIIGSLLGDGHIDKREFQPMFIVSHAENQKDYLYWKHDLMKDFCNTSPTYYKAKESPFPNGKMYMCQPQYRMCTRIHDCLLKFRAMTKRELIDNLNEFSLAILMLDDGYRDRSNWEVCLADILLEDREHFVKIMQEKFNLNSYLDSTDNRYINFRAESSRKLDEIILENISNDLDIIKNKITENDKIAEKQFRLYIKYNDEDILLKDFCRVNDYDYKYIHNAIKKYNLQTGEDIINFMDKRRNK
jgi:hypothetical protein